MEATSAGFVKSVTHMQHLAATVCSVAEQPNVCRVRSSQGDLILIRLHELRAADCRRAHGTV